MKHRTTEDLVKILESTHTTVDLSDYLEKMEQRTPYQIFPDYFLSLDAVKRYTNPEIVQLSGIERSYYYQIIDKRRHPGRDKVISLALGCGIGLEDTNRCLKFAGLAPLYPRNRRDAILIFAIEEDLTVLEANDLLFQFKQETLS